MQALLEWHFSTKPQTDNAEVSGTRDVFEARSQKVFSALLKHGFTESDASLVYSIIGELGNNSFDHNLGFWRDQPGCYFSFEFDASGVTLGLADRGRGIFNSLKRVLPELQSDQEAIEIAFQRVISGRAPEQRGNGLKFVRAIINGNPKRGLVARSGTGLLACGGHASWIATTSNSLFSEPTVGGTIALIRWEKP